MQNHSKRSNILSNQQNSQLWNFAAFVVLLYIKQHTLFDEAAKWPLIQMNSNTGDGGSKNNSGTGGNAGNAGSGRASGDDEGADDSDDIKASNNEDTGTGIGGSDYVGKATGNMIDDSISDTVTGGGIVGDKTSRTSGTTVGGIMGTETEVGSAAMGDGFPKAGRAIKSGEPGASDAGKPYSGALGINDISPKIEINEEDDKERRAVDKGTGTGAAMNNLNEADVDAGTGSARRGNRAGMPDEDTGKISGGTMTSTGIDDAGTGPEK